MTVKLGVRPRILLEAAVLLLLLAALAARSLSLSRSHYVPIYDEVSYLDQARDFARRGEAGVVACYLRGECREDNRNPLYAMLVAPLMKDVPTDFPRAKLATLACALALALAVYALGLAAWPETALLAAAFAALSSGVAHMSQSLLGDVLLAALWAAAVAVLLAWRERRWAWAAFGALAGLGYLAKGDAHVLLLAAAALAARRRGRTFYKAPELWAAAAGFAATAGFLLWRNTVVWGDPFHHVATRMFWLDDWTSFMARAIGPGDWTGVGPLSYWRSHTLAQIAGRLRSGAGAATLQLLEAAGPGPTAAARPAGLLVVVLAAAGALREWKDGRRDEVLAVAVPIVPLLAALAWTAPAGAQGIRFYLPIVACLWPVAAATAWTALRRGLELEKPAALQAGVALAAAAGLLAWRAGLQEDPRRLWAQPPHWDVTASWLRRQEDPQGFLISSDSIFSVWEGAEDLRRAFDFDASDDALRRYIGARRLRLVLVDTRVPSFPRHLGRLGPFDDYGPTSFLGWPRCFHDPVKPSQFLVYCKK